MSESPEKTYYFEKEIGRLADACEKMSADISVVKTDIAILKNHKATVFKADQTKPAATGGAVGAIVTAIIGGIYQYFTGH